MRKDNLDEYERRKDMVRQQYADECNEQKPGVFETRAQVVAVFLRALTIWGVVLVCGAAAGVLVRHVFF